MTLRLAVLAFVCGTLLPAADEALVARAFDHYYNLEYDEGLADFRTALKNDPGNATRHNNLAQMLLYREMFRNGALESEMVSGNNAFLRRPKLKTPADFEKEFYEHINRSMAISEDHLQKNPRDTEPLYALGVAYGLRSNYGFLVKKAWSDALHDATEARKLHNKVSEIDPAFVDARLVQGVHDYIIGSLPPLYRSLGFLFGFRGDRDQGVKTLQMVAERGKRNKVDAEVILCALYRREHRWRDALPLLNDLLQRYPRNYLLRFEKTELYSATGQQPKALAELDELDRLKKANAPGYGRVAQEKIDYERANVHFWHNDYDAALASYRRVLSQPRELDLNTGVLSYMRMGQIFDMTNRHSDAVNEYRKAIAFAPEAEAAKESRHYISAPYHRRNS